MRRTIAYIVLILAASAALADVPPRVALTLLPTSTLPGLPVGFLLTITSSSAQPQIVFNSAQLKVTTATSTFNAVGLQQKTTLTLPSDQLDKCGITECLTIPPNSARQVYIRFGPLLVENEFFADRRLSQPGRYDLQVTLFFGRSLTGPFGNIESDTQTLLIQQPSGSDTAVWNLLQQTSNKESWSEEDWIYLGGTVALQIRGSYPDSSYAVWVAGIGTMPDTTPSAKLAQLDAALRQSLPPALRDELLLEKGGILAGLSHNALFAERDADTAVSLADQAREVLAELRNTAATAYTRGQANDVLSHLMTRTTALATIRSLADRDAPAPQPLMPRVECVQRGAGQSFSARFGYSNPNKTLKVLQIGADNQVTPAPRGTGQPRVFTPGDHPNVFIASSPGGNLIWHLDGNKATATADFPTQCTK